MGKSAVSIVEFPQLLMRSWNRFSVAFSLGSVVQLLIQFARGRLPLDIPMQIG
jgi:hypothetical protein